MAVDHRGPPLDAPADSGALAADLRRYRMMVEHAAEGIAVGQGGHIRFANQQCLALLGVSAQDAGRRPMIEYVHPDDRAMVAARRDRRTLGEPVPAYEARFLRDDGELRWLEIAGVVVDWEGAPANLFFLKDMTERRVLDEALKKALAEREAILQTATVGVCFLVGRRHQWLNRTLAAMLGYEPEELLGRETRVHYASDADFERVGAEAYRRIAETGRYSGEVRMKRKDGSLLWVQIDGTAVTQDGVAGTVWTYVDVTARILAAQETEKALARERELGELKTKLLSMASHEFRTPLAAILSSAELIAHYGAKIDAEEQRGIMSDLVAAARRMQLMLEDMLTLGQAEAGRLHFQPRPVDLDALCRQAIAEVRSAHPRHRIVLQAGTAGTRAVDPRLVQYILANLLANGCKYSPDGSEVTLDLACDGPALRLKVTDSGIGIAEEDLPHLFQSFRRGANVGHRPGSGLGLAIVKRCVDLHGGEIRVISKLGEGSTFSVTLPLPP